jgi:hypothetical protein
MSETTVIIKKRMSRIKGRRGIENGETTAIQPTRNIEMNKAAPNCSKPIIKSKTYLLAREPEIQTE